MCLAFFVLRKMTLHWITRVAIIALVFSLKLCKREHEKSLESAISPSRYHVIVPVQLTLWMVSRWRRSPSGNWKMAPYSLQMWELHLRCAAFICIWRKEVSAIMLVFCVTIIKGFQCKTYMLIDISGVAQGANMAWERNRILRIIQDEIEFHHFPEWSPR